MNVVFNQLISGPTLEVADDAGGLSLVIANHGMQVRRHQRQRDDLIPGIHRDRFEAGDDRSGLLATETDRRVLEMGLGSSAMACIVWA